MATQLGLLDDAVRLYRECGRYDLLNRLYQAAGLWERALEVAESKDGINLSTTHQLYAQHLEKVGRKGLQCLSNLHSLYAKRDRLALIPMI